MRFWSQESAFGGPLKSLRLWVPLPRKGRNDPAEAEDAIFVVCLPLIQILDAIALGSNALGLPKEQPALTISGHGWRSNSRPGSQLTGRVQTGSPVAQDGPVQTRLARVASRPFDLPVPVLLRTDHAGRRNLAHSQAYFHRRHSDAYPAELCTTGPHT